MSLSYDTFKEKNATRKVTLAWLEPSLRLLTWELVSGAMYRKQVDFYVINMAENLTGLTQASSSTLNAGEWYYDPLTNYVYVRTLSDDNPDDVIIISTFRMFFADEPLILTHDMTESGVQVNYEGLIESASEYGHDYDTEQLGSALEGQGNIRFQNNSGYFDFIFDRYFFENKRITIWSWSPQLSGIDEAKKIFSGLIDGKDYSPSIVSFGLKDFISELKNKIPLTKFVEGEGVFPESTIGKVKRRLYGFIQGLRVRGLDNILDGFTLTGTVEGPVGTDTLTGTGTLFLDEVSQGDNLNFEDSFFRVEQVVSDTEIRLTANLDVNVSGTMTVDPGRPWRKKNREWHIAGHKLHEVKATITEIISLNRFRVDTIENIIPGDTVLINGVKRVVRKAVGDLIILNTNLGIAPSVSDLIEKYPIQAVNIGTTDFEFIRDFTIDNSGTDAKLIFDELAEFNVTTPAPYVGTATFTNASRTVTGTDTQFDVDFQVRDWISPNDSNSTWYEILAINSPTEIELRIPFAASTIGPVAGQKRNIDLISDDSIVTIDCLGLTEDGTATGDWVKTGPDTIRHLLTEAGLGDRINTDSFDTGNVFTPETLALKVPKNYDSSLEVSIRDVVNIVNQSVFGSIFNNSEFEIAYTVLSPFKPATLIELQDDDILDWQSQVRSDDIVSEVVGSYNPRDADRFTGEASTEVYTKTNDVTKALIGVDRTKEVDLFLSDPTAAQIMTDRYALLNEYSTAKIIIRTKLNLTRNQLGDVLYFNLDRMFVRFGNDVSRRKMGLVTSIKKSGRDTIVEIDDLGSLWNKVATIAPNDAVVYEDASDDAKIRNGYITDDIGLVEARDFTYKINLIG